MATFLDLHRDAIAGTIATFDRLIFKGHLNALFPQGAFKRYLDRRGILLKDAGSFFEAETARLKAHAKALADDSGRPFVYLNAAHTHATGTSKESLARRIAEDDGVTQGLVCAFSTLEPCRSFTVAGNRETKRLEVVRRPRQCLHFYWYLIDPEFGWMHVRLQSWAPYSIQVYVNGREWLARQLDRRGIAYSKSDNKITWVADVEAARQLCDSLTRTAWPAFLDRLARMVNPLLPDLQAGRVRLILVGDRPVRVRHRPAVQGARRARDGARRSGRGRDDRVRGDRRPALPRSQAAPGLHRRGHDRPQDAARRLSGQVPAQGQRDQVLRSPECPADRDHDQQSPGIQGSARDRPERRETPSLAPDGQVGGAFLALCPGGRGRQPASDRRPGQRPAQGRGHAGTR